jgi:transcription elongation factor Elf1
MNTPISCPKCGSTTEVEAANSADVHAAVALAKCGTGGIMAVGTVLTGGILIPICASALLWGTLLYIMTEKDDETDAARFECLNCHHKWS